MTDAIGSFFYDMTPTPLAEAGDVGPWVPIPDNKVGHVQACMSADVGAAAVVACDFTNRETDAPKLGAWLSEDLTGPSTGDAFVPMTGAGFHRLRLVSIVAGSVTGTSRWR